MKSYKKPIYPIKFFVLNKYIKVKNLNENARYLHRMYFNNRKKINKKSKVLVGLWNWFFRELCIKSRTYINQNRHRVKEITGKSLLKQYADLITTCVSLPCKIQDYYIYNLYMDENKQNARDYIFKYETKNNLYKMMGKKEKSDFKDVSPLTNKGDFYVKALNDKLPTAKTICVIQKGSVHYYNDKPKKGSLFVKGLSLRGGKGCGLWEYKPKKGLYKKRGIKKLYTFSELIEYYKNNSYKNPVIIQKKIKNHPDLLDLSCDALATCRLVTLLNEKDEPEIVAAVFRMASSKGVVVDNIHKGGIAAPIEISSGILGKATNLGKALDLDYLTHHPKTKAIIEGRKLPKWDSVKSLAIKAHESFKPRVIIGWDICITKNNVVIIEGNAQPCVDLIQRPSNEPLSYTRFGELMAYHIKKNADLS